MPSLRRHPLAGGGMSPHAAPSRLAPSPSTKRELLVDELPFPLRHPPKRHFWWTATSPSREPSMPGAVFPEGPAFFRGTFHARGRFPGRSCLFPGDLPCQCPFFRKVLRFSRGPSMLEAVFPEGSRTGWRTGRRKGLYCGRNGSLFDDLAGQHRQKEFNPAG